MNIREYFTILFLMISFISLGQNETEALNFSHFSPTGTARFASMGGAFGALGADLSTMATNPAGTGLYRKSEIGVSTIWSNNNTTTNYNGEINSVDKLSFQMANIGFITVNPTGNNTGWKSLNFGFAYNQLKDYNQSFVVSGDNYSSSMLDFQTDLLNERPNDYNTNAFYNADVVFWDDVDNTYYNDFNYKGANYYGTNQLHQVQTTGYAGEYDINMSGNYNDFLYFGATIGIQNIRYSNTTTHTEHAFNDTIALKNFESVDYLDARGNGFNLKLGMLVKLTHLLRIGVAYHTPTIYNFKYDYWTDVNATLNLGGDNFISKGESPYGSYNWELNSPARYMLSSAVVISRIAIVSGEIEYADYSKLSITATDYLFDEANKSINNIYKGVINARVGAEIRLWLLSLRAGAAYFDSPYQKTEANSEAYKLIYTGGIGINAGNLYFDATYKYSTSNEFYYMYGYEDSKVAVNNINNNFVATIGYRF